MPVVIDGRTYYRTAEAFKMIGVSRNTLFRWLHKGILESPERRDCRGWRIFTKEEIDALKNAINTISGVTPLEDINTVGR